MKSNVADNISQGSTRMNVCAGVRIRSIAPRIPPSTLTANRARITRFPALRWLRKAPPLKTRPVQRATVFVAFAGTGGTPLNRRAGKAIKLPPPATAFRAPPSRAAKNSKKATCGVK